MNFLESEDSVSVTGALISDVKLPTAIFLFAEDSPFTKSMSRYIPWNIDGQQVLKSAIMLSMLTYLGLQRHRVLINFGLICFIELSIGNIQLRIKIDWKLFSKTTVFIFWNKLSIENFFLKNTSWHIFFHLYLLRGNAEDPKTLLIPFDKW